MANEKVRVALYSRVSSQEQAVEGTSLEYQAESTTSFCKSQGWEIIQSYVDGGFTGKDDNRPALKRMLVDAKGGTFSKIVVYKMDRLARNLKLLLDIQDKLEKSGVSFHSVSEVLDSSTANGRHFLQMLGMVAEWEREAIIERTKAGRIQRYKEGKWAGGKPSYGYSYDKETKKLIINEPEARVIRRIFNMYDSGRSLNGIATILNEEKVKPKDKNGKGWRSTSVRNVLINPAYKGTLVVNRHSHISDINKVNMSKAITINVPPIVSEKEWTWAQEHLKNNKQVRPVREEKWLLQGLVKCGQCGLSYAAKDHLGYKYYICRGKMEIRHLDGSPRCTAKNLRADWLETQVWQRIEDILNDPNKLEPMLEETLDNLRARVEELQARLLPINEQLREIQERKTRLANEFVVKNMSPDKFKQVQSELESEETRLRSLRSSIDPEQLAELESTQAMLKFWDNQLKAMAWDTENEDGSKVKLVEGPHQVALKIVGFDNKELTGVFGFPASRRDIIDKLQLRVFVFPDRVEVNAVFPIAPIYRQKVTSVRG